MHDEHQMHHHHHKLKMTLILLVILGFIAIGIVSLLRERIVNPMRYQVSFTAEGTAFMKPDIAQITLGIKTERMPTAVEAVKENTEQMNEVITKIKAGGIEDKDIKTTSYNLNPAYDYLPDLGRSEIKGYEVRQNVTVKIRDLDSIGSIIETATNAGANQVGNISFTIDDMSEIKKLAREEAVSKAKAKAKEMAELTGIKLGKLVNVYENDNATPMYRNYALSMDEATGMGGGAPEIQVGENEVNLGVTLVYEVK